MKSDGSGLRQPLSHQAYERIKYKIVTLDLPPGSVVDEASLQDELELGRTPIREALKRLSWEKLVTIAPRRGIFVTDIAIGDLQHLLELRIAMEGLAARLAAQRGSQTHWKRMEAVMQRLAATDISNHDAIFDADEAFHHLLYRASENLFLVDQLTVIYTLTKRLWYFVVAETGIVEGSVAEHSAILEALRNRNGDAAARELAHHIQHLQARMQPLILGNSSEL